MQTGEAGDDMPDWVPEGARHYIAHIEHGQTIRALARQADVHASTILRQVRRIEALRDDPLVDRALRRLSEHCAATAPGVLAGAAAGLPPLDCGSPSGGRPALQAKIAPKPSLAPVRPENDAPVAAISAAPAPAPAGKGERGEEGIMPGAEDLAREGLRILRRLAEAGTVLAVARDMEMGVVVRDGADGGLPQRLAVVARNIAEAMALNDWIGCDSPEARVARYRITGAGRAALRRLVAAADNRAHGFAEQQGDFGGVPVDDPALRHMRTLLAESPLTGLARRHDRDGQPFLGRDLVAAAERLREDFELSEFALAGSAAWEGFLNAALADAATTPAQPGPGAAGIAAARDRVRAALYDLGPGLADVALRCCCLLEGLESLERRMGWSARSGKIVLRIALQRLQDHYRRTQGRFGPMIG
jgi:hypothetical protein